jgi:hypothetical protein
MLSPAGQLLVPHSQTKHRHEQDPGGLTPAARIHFRISRRMSKVDGGISARHFSRSFMNLVFLRPDATKPAVPRTDSADLGRSACRSCIDCDQ